MLRRIWNHGLAAAALTMAAGIAVPATVAFGAASGAIQESQPATTGDQSDGGAAPVQQLRAATQATLDQAAARLQIRSSQDREWKDFAAAFSAWTETAAAPSVVLAPASDQGNGAALLSLSAARAMSRAQALRRLAVAAGSLQNVLDSNQRDVFAQIVRTHLRRRAMRPWLPMMGMYIPPSNSNATQSDPPADPPGGGAGARGGAVHGGGFHGNAAGGLRSGGPRGGGAPGGGFRRGGPVPGGVAHGGLYGRFNGAGFRGWWWGPGWFGLDLYLAALPWYYDAYIWDGVPYYYVNGDYWVWNGDVGEYEQVQPPAQIAAAGPGEAPNAGLRLFVYPKNGQTAQQQSKDEAECSHWASGQTGYTPPASEAGQSAGAATENSGAAAAQRQDYLRADSACLEGRGYSVE